MAKAEPKIGKSKSGDPMHYSVGALIKRDGKYLLLDRMFEPLGFAGIAGHIDEGETDVVGALAREIREECGLVLKNAKLIAEKEVAFNRCKRGINIHYWYLYEVETEGDPVWNKDESKSIGWYSPEEIKNLKLEPIWNYYFKELGVI